MSKHPGPSIDRAGLARTSDGGGYLYRFGRAGFTAFAVLGSLAAIGPAHASTVLSYPNFDGACSGGGLTCVGNTAVVGSALRLSPADYFASGAGYSTTPITLGPGATFSTTFQFQITDAGGIAPADGLTFVLAQSAAGLGGSGGQLGYAGVPNSVAVEFDTYNNGGTDISSNHVAIDVNGVLTDYAAANPYGVATCDFSAGYLKPGCMSNGDVWTANVVYDGAKLTVTVQDGSTAPQTVIGNYAIDIAGTLGTTTAFVGFTAATGSGIENHDILNWQLANDTSLTPPVPEPGTWALLLTGLAGLAGVARRRRS